MIFEIFEIFILPSSLQPLYQQKSLSEEILGKIDYVLTTLFVK